MKIIIDIPEKTNAHIRSDYGHGVKGFTEEDREIVCEAIYHGTPYKEKPQGKWDMNKCYSVYLSVRTCLNCNNRSAVGNYCMFCGADMRSGKGESE